MLWNPCAVLNLVDLVSADMFFKRGSVQPGCILGDLRFRSTAIRIFKFVWCLGTTVHVVGIVSNSFPILLVVFVIYYNGTV